MADFEKCIPIVLGHEGGFVDNPLDKGGPTNYGISSNTLMAFTKQVQQFPISTIQNLDIETAKQIYRQYYWDPLKLDQVIPEVLALVILDMAVLRGIGNIVRNLQNTLGIVIDGIMGPQTLDSLNGTYPAKICTNFLFMEQVAFCEIVKANPSQSIFLTGWIKRTHDLLEYALGLKSL